MERNEQLFFEIEAYLLGEMSPEEAQSFARRVESDPELATEVAGQRLELEALEVMVEDNLRAAMTGWSKDPPASSAPKKAAGGPWLWLLLAFGLVGVAFFWWPTAEENLSTIPAETPVAPAPADPAPIPVPEVEKAPTVPAPASQEEEQDKVQKKKEEPVYAQEQPTVSPPDNSRLLAMATSAYRQPEELTLKSVGEDDNSPLDAGLEAYAAEDFSTAITEFSALDASVGEAYFERAQELLGHAYFRAGRYPEAAAVFATFAADTEFRSVREYGEWYLLLSLLPDYNQEKERVDALVAKILGEEGHAYGGLTVTISEKLK